MTIALFSNNQFSTFADAKQALSIDVVDRQVQSKKTSQCYIDVAQCMEALINVGPLLKHAYAGVRNVQSSDIVIDVLTDYSKLIAESKSTTATFVTESVKAIRLLKEANRFTDSEKYKTALAFLGRTSTIAATMAELSRERMIQASKICQLAHEAVLGAKKDERAKEKELAEINASILENKKKEAENQSSSESYLKALAAEEAMIKSAKNSADLEATRAYRISLTAAITQPIGQMAAAMTAVATAVAATAITKDVTPPPTAPTSTTSSSGVSALENQSRVIIESKEKEIAQITDDIKNKESALVIAEEAKEKNVENITKLKEEITALKMKQAEAKKSLADLNSNLSNPKEDVNGRNVSLAALYFAQQESAAIRRAEYVKMQINANRELAGALVMLSGLTSKTSQIDRSIAALQTAGKALRSVKIIFQNIEFFWKSHEKNAKELKEAYETTALYVDEKEKDAVLNAIYDSAIGWLTFALTSNSALEQLQRAGYLADAAYLSLPTNDAEANAILDSGIAKELLRKIDQKSAELEKLGKEANALSTPSGSTTSTTSVTPTRALLPNAPTTECSCRDYSS